MRRHVIPFLIITILFLSLAYLLVNSTLVVSLVFPQLINRYVKDVRLESLHLGAQSFRFPDTFVWTDVRFTVRQDEKKYEGLIRQLAVYDLAKLWRGSRQIKFFAQNADVSFGRNKAQGMNFKALLTIEGGDLFIAADGLWDARFVEAAPFQCHDFSARIKRERGKIQIFEIFGTAYGGKARGQVVMEYTPALTYVCWFEFSGVHAQNQDLTALEPSVLPYLKGQMDGTVRLVGAGSQLHLLAMDLDMPGGGTMQAALLQKVIPHVTNAQQRMRLEMLKQEGEIEFDRASFRVNRAKDRKAAVTVGLQDAARGLNFQENIRIDIDKRLRRFYLQP